MDMLDRLHQIERLQAEGRDDEAGSAVKEAIAYATRERVRSNPTDPRLDQLAKAIELAEEAGGATEDPGIKAELSGAVDRLATAYDELESALTRGQILAKLMFLLEKIDPKRATNLTTYYSGRDWPYSMAGLAFGDVVLGREELAEQLLGDLLRSLAETYKSA